MYFIPKTPLVRGVHYDQPIVYATNKRLSNPSLRRRSYHPLANNLLDLCIETETQFADTHNMAVFVTPDPNQHTTNEYGNAYYFFPMLPFSSVWFDLPHDAQSFSMLELRHKFKLPYHDSQSMQLLRILFRQKVYLKDIDAIASDLFKTNLSNTLPVHVLHNDTPHQDQTANVYEVRIVCSEYVLISVQYVRSYCGTYQEFINTERCTDILN